VKNFFQKVLLSRYGIIFIVIVIVSLCSWLTRPREIHYKYNGVKYQIGNLQSSEPVIIEIKGKYKKKLLQKTQIFEGKIIINGEMCYGGRGTEDIKSTFVFKKMNFGHIDSDNLDGLLYVSQYKSPSFFNISESEVSITYLPKEC
jgi:hypothetical protein